MKRRDEYALRACYPMDVYKLVKAICEYEGHPPLISKTNIERAVGLYFARRSPAGAEKLSGT